MMDPSRAPDVGLDLEGQFRILDISRQTDRIRARNLHELVPLIEANIRKYRTWSEEYYEGIASSVSARYRLPVDGSK